MTFRDKGLREQVLAFGPYQLFCSQKILREGQRAVRLGSRAIDILIALVERAGEVVSKNVLMEYAWPDTVVEENNLRVHLTAIRKILGDGHADKRYIINVAGRGYSFVAPVTRIDGSTQVPGIEVKRRAFLPSLATHVVGRAQVIDSLVRQVPDKHFVTIVGAGGVGKTTVALATAERLTDTYQDVWFVDMSTIDDPSSMISAIAAAIGVSARSDDPMGNLIPHLKGTHALMLFDNCEHVVTAAAEVVERIRQDAPEVDVLATTREPLSARGEHLVHLAALNCPPDTAHLPIERALSFTAVELFVERAGAGLEPFELTAANVDAVADICRRLDGLPLAIELVAAHVGTFGVDGLKGGFGDQMLLTAKGRRTADPRQQSLHATLDWSYQILPVIEQTVLRRLAVFRGLFSAESAVAVVSGGASLHAVLNALMSLSAKSLLATDVSGSGLRYRLLHVTRVYALEQLQESGERDEMVRRHAAHVRSLLEGALEQWEGLTPEGWLAQYGNLIDDLRAAQLWAFGPHGNLELGIALTVASLPICLKLYLFDEIKRQAPVALDALSRMSPPKPLWELRINNALIAILTYSGASQQIVRKANDRALELAKQTGQVRYLIEPLTSRAVLDFDFGNYDKAVDSADRVDAAALSADEPLAMLLANRVAAQAYHFAGSHERARALAERVLRHPHGAVPLIYAQAPIDRSVSMRIILSQILWLQGFADQAEDVAAEAVELAVQGPALCLAWSWAACPVAFWRGDLERASLLTRELVNYSRRLGVDKWTKLGVCYQATLDHLAGDASAVLPLREHRADAMPQGALSSDILATIHPVWIDTETRARAQRNSTGWATPELLRAEGERLRREGARADAQIQFEVAIALARERRAVAWELRAAMSLARLWCDGRSGEGCSLLESTLARVSEGRSTADVREARTLLQQLAARGD